MSRQVKNNEIWIIEIFLNDKPLMKKNCLNKNLAQEYISSFLKRNKLDMEDMEIIQEPDSYSETLRYISGYILEIVFYPEYIVCDPCEIENQYKYLGINDIYRGNKLAHTQENIEEKTIVRLTKEINEIKKRLESVEYDISTSRKF